MYELAVEVKIPKSRQISVTRSMSLGRLGGRMAHQIRKRVRDRMRDARGRRLPGLARDWPRKGALWVPASGSKRFPRPRGGKKAGQWRIFRSYRDYCQSLGRRPVRNFDLTGQMWRAMQVKIKTKYGQPLVVIGFRGSVQHPARADYEAQLAARRRGHYYQRRKRKKAEGGGYTYERREISKALAGGKVKAASAASKAAYQKVMGGHLDRFLTPSQDELDEMARLGLAQVADDMRTMQTGSETLPQTR
jgi:hypothetical protein